MPDIPAAEPATPGVHTPPRYEAANRTQIELTPTDLEALLPPGHAARFGVAICRAMGIVPHLMM